MRKILLGFVLVFHATTWAEEAYRWRDGRGTVHYSNESGRAPAGAPLVTTDLGLIGGSPIGSPLESLPPRAPQPVGVTPTCPAADGASCVRRTLPWALPLWSVDLDRRDWYAIDAACGPQHDFEAWLRRAVVSLELRTIGD